MPLMATQDELSGDTIGQGQASRARKTVRAVMAWIAEVIAPQLG